MSGINSLDSFNLKYLMPQAQNPFVKYDSGASLFAFPSSSASFTPANMGTGIFNMNNQLIQPSTFGSMGMPNKDLGTMFFEMANMQNQYLTNMYAALQKLKVMQPQNKIIDKTSGNTVVYGNNNFDVTKKYTKTASDLDKNLQGVLKGKGAKLLELQEKYGINAAFLAALVNAESGHGKSNAARNKNNVAGIMSKESNYMKLASFNSVDECLESLASNLSRNYVGKGLTTISEIHKKYCPVGAQNDPTGMNKNWGSVIGQLTEKYERA